MMQFSIYTLGCKVNQYETQAMEQLLTQRCHEERSWDEPCDAYIINTCTVTAVSDKKSRNMIRRIRREHPAAVVAVCGCYAQVEPEAVAALDVDVVAGTGGRVAFLDAVEAAVSEKRRSFAVDDALRRRTFEVLPAGGMAERTRAMLKVQDGCSNFCTYCIIPYARGPVRSLPLEEAVAQAREVAQAGYREMVVTGIEISSWGRDLPEKPPLWKLLSAICESAPAVRVRLGSLEPRTVDEDFCQALAGFSNLCPQFHLSLQSGSDTVLKRMHRRYDTARYLESVALLRRYFPGCAVTTDLIVAFPGETEEEFQESLDFLRTCAFSKVHVFPYSRRAGTPAAKMPGQHTNEEKEARSARALAVASALEEAYQRDMVGKEYPVLFEEMHGEMAVGHAPNYVLVHVAAEIPRNTLATVRVTGLCPGGVVGEIAE